MNEAKKTLKRLAFYGILLALSIISCANVIPDVFPTRNVSTIYLLILSVCLVLYYSHRVSPAGHLSAAMKAVAWMELLLILLRGIKYSAFSEVGVLARYTWYLYYVPTLLIPLFLFYIALLVFPKKSSHVAKIWYPVLFFAVIFILFVLTNDAHQLIFGFKPGFENWDGDYSHGKLFYVLTIFQYALYIAAIIILIIKCRITSSKKRAWIIFIPFFAGIAMCVLLVTGKMPKISGVYVIEFPEALAFMVAGVLECCLLLGLIPTNTDYGKLFRKFSISAQITDKKGAAVYSSGTAKPLTTAQFNAQNGARIEEHTVLHKMKIPGGFGFWQDDMTGLDRLNEELADAKEELAQEAELKRLQNELKEKQIKTEQRTLVYDNIAKRTQKQSRKISLLAKEARLSADKEYKEKCRKMIVLLGTYIKRYANLMLLSRESGVIETGELALAFSEVLRRLNYYGVPGELITGADGYVRASAALSSFEAFQTLLEENINCLYGVFVNLSAHELKMTFENLNALFGDETENKLSECGVLCEIQKEDEITYVCLKMPKGGEES